MSDPTNIQVKILIRFSYLAANGFKVSKQGPEKLAELLYDPERLDRRFRYFQALTLPSLLAQTDMNFSTAVLVGNSFPQEALARLQETLSVLPSSRVVSMAPLSNYRAATKAFFRLPTDPDATHIATVRLDDDDAMHVGTVARIRELATHIMPVRRSDAPFVIGFNQGYFMDFSTQGIALTEVRERTPLGIGLTLVAPAGKPENIYRRNHRKVAEHYDCYTELAQPMFIRTVHQDNDSAAYASGGIRPMDIGEKREKLQRDFATDFRLLEDRG